MTEVVRVKVDEALVTQKVTYVANRAIAVVGFEVWGRQSGRLLHTETFERQRHMIAGDLIEFWWPDVKNHRGDWRTTIDFSVLS